MGTEYSAKCKQCGCKFTVSEGGGFFFHLLHCDTCGIDKSISFEELGELHLRYLKGLTGPYCIASSAHDKAVREHYPGEPISEEEYHGKIQEILGQCECGGHFRFNAPARCPQCRSDDIEDTGEMMVLYD